MKINAAVEFYTSKLAELGKSKATVVAYSTDLRQLAEYFNGINITEITQQDLEKYVISLKASSLSKKTISRKLNSIKSMFRHFYEVEKEISDNPSWHIKHPKFTDSLPGFLTEAEFIGLRETAKDNLRLFTVIELNLQTGMRISEIVHLRTSDLQLDSEPGQLLVQKLGKNPMRLIELNSRAVKTLRDYLPYRESLELDNPSEFLFVTKSGKPIIIRNLRAGINRIFKRAGLSDKTVNDLRNTFIVHQLDKGVSLPKVAQTVGHRRFTSTEKFLPLISRSKLGKKENLQEL